MSKRCNVKKRERERGGEKEREKMKLRERERECVCVCVCVFLWNADVCQEAHVDMELTYQVFAAYR